MSVILWVAAGGAIGSATRYAVAVASQRLVGADFPWGTLAVNVSGCFAMGILAALVGQNFLPNENLKAFLGTRNPWRFHNLFSLFPGLFAAC